jgi:ATPase subunit of ABC transporter with duplicated ATPase domains
MGSLIASNLAYAHPGGDMLFSGVSFTLKAGQHAGLVGANGVGKSTLLRCLSGDVVLEEGEVDLGGRCAWMPQDVGLGGEGRTVHELLLDFAPGPLRTAGRAMLEAESALFRGEDAATAGTRLGAAIGAWSDLGGYELQGRWDAICRRVVGVGFDDVASRQTTELSGGERKRIVLDLLLTSDASVLLLDEPDNFLDVAAKRALEASIAASRKTILIISHDRELLCAAVDAIVTLEGSGAWVHGGSYATYPEAREHRQRLLGDALTRWREEERRLYRYFKLLKERAKYAPGNAKRADAAQTRWQRFVDAGPPPPPITDHQIQPSLRGADSARRVLDLRGVGLPGIMSTFSDEVHFGERLGLIGRNGSGKTHLMRLLAGEQVEHSGAVVVGPRVSPGLFTQTNVHPSLATRVVLDIVIERVGAMELAMRALARYGLAESGRRTHETLSGGQKARLEILLLELAGHNLLLLDEPTDNLDINSTEALERALDTFHGTVIAVSHDRAFLRRLDRFWLLDDDGVATVLPDPATALEALAAGSRGDAVPSSRAAGG